MDDAIARLIEPGASIAVAGASRDEGKYGNRIFSFLLEHGYDAYPINPNADEVAGRRCYANIKDLPMVPTLVDMVVPPANAGGIIDDCIEAGVEAVWFQPGSEDESAMEKARKAGLHVISGRCIMVEIAGHGY